MAADAKGADARSSRCAWSAFAAICVELAVWVGVGYNCMGVYADAVVEALSITRTQFMFTMTIGVLASACGNLAYGQVKRLLGMRRLLMLSGLLASCAYLLLALAQNIAMLYLGGLLLGGALALQTNNTVATAVDQWFKRNMATLVSAANTCASVVGILAATGVALLIGAAGWRVSFGVTCALSVGATLVVGLLYRGSPEELGLRPLWEDSACGEKDSDEAALGGGATTLDDGPTYAQTLRSPSFWVLAAAYLASGLVCYGLFGSLSLIAVDCGLGEAQGTMVSAALAASSISMVPLGRVCDRFGSRWLFAACMGCIALGAALFCWAPLNAMGAHVAAVIVGVGYNANNIPHGISVKEAAGTREFSRKLGTLIFFNFLGVAAGPTALNLVHDLTGSYELGLVAFVSLAAAVVAGAFAGTRHISAA